jgi:hypothetical protein
MKSFNWNFEGASRKWADAARTIINFDHEHRDEGQKYLIVKYEDILNSTQQELMKIFSFLGLDSEKYDFSPAHNLPIKGS